MQKDQKHEPMRPQRCCDDVYVRSFQKLENDSLQIRNSMDRQSVDKKDSTCRIQS